MQRNLIHFIRILYQIMRENGRGKLSFMSEKHDSAVLCEVGVSHCILQFIVQVTLALHSKMILSVVCC